MLQVNHTKTEISQDLQSLNTRQIRLTKQYLPGTINLLPASYVCQHARLIGQYSYQEKTDWSVE